jgi:hypothetical protein
MKKVLDAILNLVTLIAPIPTGWAVYAGLSVREAWPMPLYIAVPGAVALVAVSISISSYIIDVNSFNKSLRRADKTGELAIQTVNALPGWGLLGLATAAEITLALLVSIIPGLRTYAVLAFPLLTGAGIFTFVLRVQLAERMKERDSLRIERRIAKENRPESERTPKGKKRSPTNSVKGWPDSCPHCGAQIRSANAWSSHSGRWCPVLHPKELRARVM